MAAFSRRLNRPVERAIIPIGHEAVIVKLLSLVKNKAGSWGPAATQRMAKGRCVGFAGEDPAKI